ncbi:MAG: hypothetical protein SGI89_03505 [bacterium]|nr:hypothetical protein [bacterium]
MSEKEDTPKPEKTMLERIRETIPMITPMIMISGIAFTYYSYFYDIQKIPQLVSTIKIEKVQETKDFFMVKLFFRIKNQSKSRVEIIANLGKLYGYKCSMSDTLSSSEFTKNIQDTVSQLTDDAIEISRNFDRTDETLIGFYQPIHNSTWLQPDEIGEVDVVTAIPKKFDLAYLLYSVDYATREENLVAKYRTEANHDINYYLYKIDSNDSTKITEVKFDEEDDVNWLKEHKMARRVDKTELWLSVPLPTKQGTNRSDTIK